MQEFEAAGTFFRPGDTQNSVTGTVSYSAKDGVQLSLVGSLFSNLNDHEFVDCLHGVCPNCPVGNLISLHECRPRGSHTSFPGGRLESYRPRYLLAGIHVNEISSQLFNRVIVKTDILDVWFDQYCFNINRTLTDNGNSPFSIQCECKEHDAISIPYGTLKFKHAPSLPAGKHRKISLYDDVLIVVDLITPMTLEEISEQITWPIQSYLTFVTQEPNVLENLSVINTSKNNDHEGASVFYKQIREPAKHDLKKLHEHQSGMLMTYSETSTRNGNVLTKWFERWPDYKQCLSGLIGSTYRDHLYVDTEFFSLATSLEAFQSTFELKGVKASFRDKVSALCGKHWHLLNAMGVSHNAFIDKIVNSRNNKAHGAKISRGNGLSDFGTFQANQALITLISGSVLLELGFNSEETKERLYKTMPMKNLLFFKEKGNLELI